MINRIFTVLNFLGVCAVAALCSWQWGQTHGLEQRLSDAQKTNQIQSEKLADQDKTIRQDDDDLSDTRQKLTISESALKDAEAKSAANAVEIKSLTTQREGLKATIDKYVAALADRDAALKRAADQIQLVATDRNAAIQKFNDLAEKYNALVKQQGATEPQK